MHPSFTVVAVCMLCESVFVWQVMQPALFLSASAWFCVASGDFGASGLAGSAGVSGLAGASSSAGPRLIRWARRTGLVSLAWASATVSRAGDRVAAGGVGQG